MIHALPLLTVRTLPLERDVRIVLEGEIDIGNVEGLGALLRTEIGIDPHLVYLDLVGVTYTDSSGLGLLVVLAEELSQRRQELRIVVVPDGPVGRILTMAGLERALRIYPTIEAASSAPDGL